jgi:hypothetical protein
MGRLVAVTDRYSPAWKSSFGFWPDAEMMPDVAALRCHGVRSVAIRIGCTTPGEVFTDLAEVVAERDVAVDVMWLKRVRDLCESMTPVIISMLRIATEPNDDPEDNFRASVDLGNYLLHVDVYWRGEEATVSADFYFPSAEAEEGSYLIRRETRKPPVSPSRGDLSRLPVSRVATAAERT